MYNSLTTRERIIELREQDQNITQTRMAQEIGVSRERVRQILNSLGYTLVPDVSYKYIVNRVCNECNTVVETNKKNIGRGKKFFCNNECEYSYKNKKLICMQCEDEYLIARHIFNIRQKREYKYNFCSKVCQGRYLGQHFGKGRKSEKNE